MDLDKAKVIAIVGDVDSGKTSIAFHLLNTYKGKRDKYLFCYPNRNLPFKYIDCYSDLGRLNNAIILIDEFQLHFKVYSNRMASERLLELLSIIKHKELTLLITTQNSQNITKQIENSLDGYILTQISHLKLIKHQGLFKDIILDIRSSPFVNRLSDSLELKKGEYYQNLKGQDDNGFKSFSNPMIKKDWASFYRDDNTYKEIKIIATK